MEFNFKVGKHNLEADVDFHAEKMVSVGMNTAVLLLMMILNILKLMKFVIVVSFAQEVVINRKMLRLVQTVFIKSWIKIKTLLVMNGDMKEKSMQKSAMQFMMLLKNI